MSDMPANYELAPIGTRFLAIFIDGIIIGIIGGILFSVGGSTGGGASFVVGLIYYWYFWTRQDGQSVGKKLMNIKVIKTDGTALSDSDAIVRYIGYVVGGAIFALGFIWALFDSKQQGWHDKIAQTYVVKV
jgi:uncharacterized RDD family membrane protein YckC